MYYPQAMEKPDQKKFREAIVKDLNDHAEIKKWDLVLMK